MYTMIIQWLLLLTISSFCDSKSYDDYTLYRAIPSNDYQMKFLESIEIKYKVNYWRNPTYINRRVEFVVEPYFKHALLKEADSVGIALEPIIDNVQSAFKEQIVTKYLTRRTDSFGWESYYRLDDIYNWLTDLAQKYGNIIQVRSIGKTHEGRDIIRAKVVFNNQLATKKIIIEGGVHAREWLSPAVVTYFIDKLVHLNQSGNHILQNYAHLYKWYFVPVANPDGYEYTHNVDRMWRKNRKPYKNGVGVDLNRNFDVEFDSGIGTSNDPTSEIYRGPAPFSERESKALSELVKCKHKGLEFYVSLHAYGQYMIIPYAYTKEHVDNYDEVAQFLTAMARTIEKTNGSRYTIGNAFETIGYLSSASSTCWVKKTFGIPYVMSFELPDQGEFGFALPANRIEKISNEIYLALTYLFSPQKNITTKYKALTSGKRSSFTGLVVHAVMFYNLLFFILLKF